MTAPHVLARYAGLLGCKYGNLIFERSSDRAGDNHRLLGEFRCDCGVMVTLPISRVVNQAARTHCGCRADRGAPPKHGMRETSTYRSWQAMKSRCLNAECKDYPKYGGSGVSIYEPWIKSFESFFEQVGPRPIGTTLDRIDTNGDYVPGNVRWATREVQQRNRHTACTWVIRGVTFQTCEEAAKHFGVKKQAVWRWVRGYTDYRRNSYTPPKGDCYAINRY